jgi:hypothetical protein
MPNIFIPLGITFGGGGETFSSFASSEEGSGGAVASGDAIVDVISPNRFPEGGAVAGGTASVASIETRETSGGVIVAGGLEFVEIGSGGAVLNGGFDVSIGFIYTPEGGITVEGPDSCAVYNLEASQDFEFIWGVNATLNQDFSFFWDTGELRVLWYRIIGKGRDTQCPVVSDDVCCQKYIMNLHARTLSELCEKIKARKWKWPIDSIEVFSRPARSVDVAEDEANGINHDCNTLTPVEFCNIPECFDFCVDIDAFESIGFDMIVSRQKFFSYEAEGQVFISGNGLYESDTGVFFDEGDGGILAAGDAEDTTASLGPGHFNYTPQGQVTIGGTIDVVSSAYDYEASGAVFIFGTAGTSFSDKGRSETIMGVDMSLVDVEVFFTNDVDNQDLVVEETFVTRCDCAEISTEIDLGHNFAQNNVFAQFLVRNGLTIESPIGMRYNSVNNMWQANLSFQGLSPNVDSLERWTLVFEVKCTNTIGATILGQDVWQVGVQIVRRNLSTLEDFDTRILVALLPETACFSGDLVFTSVYDTQTDFAFIVPDATVYQNFIWDNIGMFKNDFWIDNPNLILQVTEIGVEEAQRRVNLDSILIPSDAP